MTGLELLGLAMLLVMLGAIFIGLPISFTLTPPTPTPSSVIDSGGL